MKNALFKRNGTGVAPFHTDLFVGRKFAILIGEPWDFESSVGQNRLAGEIITVDFSDDGDPSFLCSVSPFEMSGITIIQVLGVNRYSGSQDLIKQLESGKHATMNMVYCKSGQIITPDDIYALLSGSIPGSFLIGDMTLNPSELHTVMTREKKQVPPRAPLTNDELEHVTSHDFEWLKLTDDERARLLEINKRREQALQDDPAYFAELAAKHKSAMEKNWLERKASQLRPRAHEAFRLGKYREAAELYKKLLPILTPVEIKKLAMSEKRSKE